MSDVCFVGRSFFFFERTLVWVLGETKGKSRVHFWSLIFRSWNVCFACIFTAKMSISGPKPEYSRGGVPYIYIFPVKLIPFQTNILFFWGGVAKTNTFIWAFLYEPPSAGSSVQPQRRGPHFPEFGPFSDPTQRGRCKMVDCSS